MRGVSPTALPVTVGSLMLVCTRQSIDAFPWLSLGSTSFQNQCRRRLSVPRHSPLDMFQPPSCANTPPSITPHLGKKQKHQTNPWVTVSLPSYKWMGGSIQRATTLRANPGADGNGPGTQQLSRKAKLAISVLIDLIGVSSYTVPGLGELSDVGWAPISSALIFYLYGNSIFAGLAFVEEILPGLDFIPTATIAWFLTNSEVGQNVAKASSGKADKASKTGNASSGSSPPPVPPSTPFREGETSTKDRSRRALDADLTESVVIDVDGD